MSVHLVKSGVPLSGKAVTVASITKTNSPKVVDRLLHSPLSYQTNKSRDDAICAWVPSSEYKILVARYTR